MSVASVSIKFQLRVIGKHARGWSPFVTGTSIVDLPGSGYQAHGLRIQKRVGTAREVLDLFVGDNNYWRLCTHSLGDDGSWSVKKQTLFDMFHGGGPTTNSDANDMLYALQMYVVSHP